MNCMCEQRLEDLRQRVTEWLARESNSSTKDVKLLPMGLLLHAFTFVLSTCESPLYL